MKINWKSCIKLEDLKIGNTFVWEDNLYIKTDICDADTASNRQILTINLETGNAEYFFTDSIVTPIKAEITVAGN